MGEARARLGARIKQIRLERQMTQEAVAERAKRSYKYIGEVERGAANPSVDVLESLAAALGVQVADFFDRVPVSAYPFRERDTPLVREVATSLAAILTRIEHATSSRPPRRRSKKP